MFILVTLVETEPAGHTTFVKEPGGKKLNLTTSCIALICAAEAARLAMFVACDRQKCNGYLPQEESKTTVIPKLDVSTT